MKLLMYEFMYTFHQWWYPIDEPTNEHVNGRPN